jgi:hypothetical protein
MEILSIISIIVIAVDCWIWGYRKGLRKATKLSAHLAIYKLKKAMEQKGLSEEEIKQRIKDFIEAEPDE